MDCDDGFVDRDFEEVSMEFCLKINELSLSFFFFLIKIFFLNFRKESEQYYSINRKIKDKKEKRKNV